MKKVVLASNNAGKLSEFKTLLIDCGLHVIAQSEFNVSSIEETGLTFVENAILKARHACNITGLPAISDDSGIEVDALNGAPGIYSARFGHDYVDANTKQGTSDQNNNAKLLNALKRTPDSERTARYQCVLVYMRHADDPTPTIVQGAWEGSILLEARGSGGFGYDPLFWVPTHQCASAELEKAEKNRISHRAIAMQKLIHELRD